MAEKQTSGPRAELLIDFSQRDLARSFFWSFFCADVVLLMLDLTFNYFMIIDALPVRRLFNLAREDGIGTYIGSFQTLCVGFMLVLIWAHAKISKLPKNLIRFWGGMAGFFIYAAFDDAAELHERYGSILKSLFEGSSSEPGMIKKMFAAFPSYPWQLLLGPFLAWILFLMVKYFIQDVRDNRQRGLLMTAILCYVAATMIDFVEGVDGFFSALAKNLSVETYAVSHLFKAGEEFIELLGTTFFLTGFTQVFLSKVQTLRVIFAPAFRREGLK